jgi:hypothetical protein
VAGGFDKSLSQRLEVLIHKTTPFEVGGRDPLRPRRQ